MAARDYDCLFPKMASILASHSQIFTVVACHCSTDVTSFTSGSADWQYAQLNAFQNASYVVMVHRMCVNGKSCLIMIWCLTVQFELHFLRTEFKLGGRFFDSMP
jgi:hypothetical protein